MVQAMSESISATQFESRCATIRFPQTDPAGIVFYPRYFELVFRHFPGLPFARPPLAIRTHFLRPNRLGDELMLECRHDPDRGDWSVTGRMNGADCFTMESRPVLPSLPADAHRPERPAFTSDAGELNSWALDQHGRLHLSRYFEFLNMAIEEWLEDVLELKFHEMHVGRKVGIPTVQFDTRVAALPAAGERLSIWIRPTEIGSRALTFTSWLVKNGRCLVQNEQVVVFVRMLADGYESIAIPDDIRSVLLEQLTATGGA